MVRGQGTGSNVFWHQLDNDAQGNNFWKKQTFRGYTPATSETDFLDPPVLCNAEVLPKMLDYNQNYDQSADVFKQYTLGMDVTLIN